MTTKTLPDSTTTTYYYSGSGVTLVNAGVQGAPGESGLNFSFYITGNNDTVINNGAVLAQRVAIYFAGSGDSVVNAAGKQITATYPDDAGVKFEHASGTIANYGVISGFANSVNGGPAGNAVELEQGGLVTNSGTLLNGGVLVRGAAGTVINSGVILGNAAYGGVYMTKGGQVTNLGSGTISANGATISYDNAPPYGVFLAGGAGTVTNAGTINAGGTSGTAGYAVRLAAGFTNRVIVDPGAVFTGTVGGGTDGSGGTDIFVGAAITPLVYSQTIDEAGILAVSETVSAGVMTLNGSGATALGTIAVGVSLSARNFILQSDGSGRAVLARRFA
jgi:fibronectin-binding autotransporter adhesin